MERIVGSYITIAKEFPVGFHKMHGCHSWTDEHRSMWTAIYLKRSYLHSTT